VTQTSAFRLLLISQWIIPFLSVAVDLWLTPSIDEASSSAEVVLFEQTWIEPSWIAWVSIPFLLLAGLATIGLYLFRPWARRLYGTALALYAAFVVMSEPVILAGPSQLLFLLDGAICGAIATWLIIARDRLQFSRETAV
jgi:hypothetical protein